MMSVDTLKLIPNCLSPTLNRAVRRVQARSGTSSEGQGLPNKKLSVPHK